MIITHVMVLNFAQVICSYSATCHILHTPFQVGSGIFLRCGWGLPIRQWPSFAPNRWNLRERIGSYSTENQY